jgi:hypothetical protein
MEIIRILVSPNQQRLAVLSGRNLAKNIEEIHQLFIYLINPQTNQWDLLYNNDLPEQFRYFSKSFHFANEFEEEEIIFLDVEKIMHYNFKTRNIHLLFKFKNPLGNQPDYTAFDENQEIGIVSSEDDVLWFNLRTQEEIDIDELYNLGDIKAILFHNDKFFVLANRFKSMLGYYLLEIDKNLEKATKEDPKYKYVIKWEEKL